MVNVRVLQRIIGRRLEDQVVEVLFDSHPTKIHQIGNPQHAEVDPQRWIPGGSVPSSAPNLLVAMSRFRGSKFLVVVCTAPSDLSVKNDLKN